MFSATDDVLLLAVKHLFRSVDDDDDDVPD